MEKCPCGSGRTYSECCEPLIQGVRQAATAEELMRARYSAYAKTEVAYILETTHPDVRAQSDERSIRKWSRAAQWHGLEILACTDGGSGDTRGQIEFIAHYSEKGEKKIHREVASFIKDGDTWYFSEADPVKPKQYVRPNAKIGRNQPCPCGSGKKHKKCCGFRHTA